MSTLPLSPSSIRTFPSSSSSSSLLRRPFPSLRLPILRRRRRGSAAGATMSDSPSSSYASALSQVALSSNSLDSTLSDLETISSLFSSSPSLPSFFSNPTFSDQTKLDLISEISSSSDLQPHTTNFLRILVDMKRIDLILEIAEEFESCYNRITGTEVAIVSSVVQLESQHLAQIAKTVQRLTGARNVRIKTEIDESLVAGFTIRYGSSGSKLIDMSVRKQLEEIAARLDVSSVVIA